ncbi:hypothetical protein V495_07292 [Pseudogymnoascus sp. VKM F-4514 (FW-929)]|nr:hypothetical protein V495_07292 [Pseudogymnoascus sp. VKM F-4514 (FW-929)]KFY51858.1 hypothetical protein V497_08795 [Pseudogymnoascus sp. VKM F-4516 (FW-969)]
MQPSYCSISYLSAIKPKEYTLSQNVILPAPSPCSCHLGGGRASKGDVYIATLKRECIAYLQLAKVTFYSASDYQGKEAELPTTDPASQDECVDIHFLLNGPAKSARITDSHCFLFRTTGCQGGASYLLTKDSPVFRPRGGGLPVEAYSSTNTAISD